MRTKRTDSGFGTTLVFKLENLDLEYCQIVSDIQQQIAICGKEGRKRCINPHARLPVIFSSKLQSLKKKKREEKMYKPPGTASSKTPAGKIENKEKIEKTEISFNVFSHFLSVFPN